MYAEEGSGGCYYHPGTHRGDGNHGRTGLMCGWSCCKELAEDAQGCRLASQHIPCAATAAAMDRFPKVAQDEGGASDGMRRRSGEAKEPTPAVSEGVAPCRKQARPQRLLAEAGRSSGPPEACSGAGSSQLAEG